MALANIVNTHSKLIFHLCSKEVAIFCSFLLGLGDSCFNTQLLSILGFLYSEDSAPAFAVFKFVQVTSSSDRGFLFLVLYLCFLNMPQVEVRDILTKDLWLELGNND